MYLNLSKAIKKADNYSDLADLLTRHKITSKINFFGKRVFKLDDSKSYSIDKLARKILSTKRSPAISYNYEDLASANLIAAKISFYYFMANRTVKKCNFFTVILFNIRNHFSFENTWNEWYKSEQNFKAYKPQAAPTFYFSRASAVKI